MNPQDPLAQLRDIHLPTAVSWWPPAPGWWIVLLLITVAIATAAYMGWRRWQAQAYRRAARAELQAAVSAWRETADDQELLLQVNRLLKRTALAAFPGAGAEPLSTQAWAMFLDQRWPAGHSSRFADTEVLSLIYLENTESQQLEQLIELSQQWIAGHEVQR